MNNKDKGNFGEQVALDYLLGNDYQFVCSQFHSRFGEIDLIVQNETFLVFVEVKLREEGGLTLPREAVTYKKQQKLFTTAQVYLSENPTSLQPRFDVIEIQTKGTKIKNIFHITNAF